MCVHAQYVFFFECGIRTTQEAHIAKTVSSVGRSMTGKLFWTHNSKHYTTAGQRTVNKILIEYLC